MNKPHAMPSYAPGPHAGPVHTEETETETAMPATPMGDQAVAIAGTANTEAITDLIKAIGSEMDTPKAELAVALLNVTSQAILLQGRHEWNTRDFLSFGVALAALSHIDGNAR